MEFKNVKYMLGITETEPSWIGCIINGETTSIRIAPKGENFMYDEMMRQVDAGELTIEPADILTIEPADE